MICITVCTVIAMCDENNSIPSTYSNEWLNKLPKFESMISEELCNEQYHKLLFNIYKITLQTKL